MFTEELVRSILDDECELLRFDLFDEEDQFEIKFKEQKIHLYIQKFGGNIRKIGFSLDDYTDTHVEKGSELCKKLYNLTKTHPKIRLRAITEYEIYLDNLVIEDTLQYAKTKEKGFIEKHLSQFKEEAEKIQGSTLEPLDFSYDDMCLSGYGRRGELFGIMLLKTGLGVYTRYGNEYRYIFYHMNELEISEFTERMNEQLGFAISICFIQHTETEG